MNVKYESSEEIIGLNMINETISYLKEIFHGMKEKLIEIKTRQEQSIYEKEVKSILSLMEKISNLLEESPFFINEEYFDFLTIYEISEHILTDEDLLMEHHDMIEEFLKKFSDMISFKLKLEPNKENHKYNKKYGEFKRFLCEREEYFFLEICPYDGKEKELIKKVSNITEGVYY